MGGQNLHIEVSFVDGVSWLCRVQRQNAASPPSDIQNAVLLSEAATLRFLASTAIPVPEVYEVAPHDTGNDVGVGYILMQKLEGRPLYMHALDDAGRHKVLQQYATVYIELSKYPFPVLGCMQGPGSFEIGPLVHERSATRDEGGAICRPGPFKSALNMYSEFAEQQIRLILNEELYVDDPLTALLVYRYLLDIMPIHLPEASTEGAAQYYLKHMDDKGDHILIDDDYNLIGVIDWEWAQAMPREFAFSAPFFLLNVGHYFSGNNGLSSDETLFASILEAAGRDDLAECIRSGRFYHRLAFCLEDNISNTEEYMCLFWGLRTLLGLAEHDNAEDDWKSWKVNAELTYANDPYVRALRNRSSLHSMEANGSPGYPEAYQHTTEKA